MITKHCDKCKEIITEFDYLEFVTRLRFSIIVEKPGKGNDKCPDIKDTFNFEIDEIRPRHCFDTTNTHFCSKCKMIAFKEAVAAFKPTNITK